MKIWQRLFAAGNPREPHGANPLRDALVPARFNCCPATEDRPREKRLKYLLTK
jgi:hypothetical protein